MLNIIKRYLFATLGLFFVALGTALSTYANLGVAPLSSFAYVLFLRYPQIEFAEFIFIVNLVYVVLQLIFYGKAFKLKYLLQLLASFIFSVFVYCSEFLITWIPCANLFSKLIIIIFASIVTALGVSIEVKSNAWMLSAEMTIAAYCYRFPKAKFGNVKIAMDSLWVLLTAGLSFIFFKNPIGSGELTNIFDQLLAKIPGSIVGFGTLILAILPGYFIRFTDTLFRKVKL